MPKRRKRGDEVVDENGTARNVVPIALLPEADAVVNALVEELGMSKAKLVGRLIGWFAKQEDLIQKTILGVQPKGEDANALLAGLLEKWAGEMRNPGPLRLHGMAGNKRKTL